jgi:hypothetical protein
MSLDEVAMLLDAVVTLQGKSFSSGHETICSSRKKGLSKYSYVSLYMKGSFSFRF